MEGVSDSKYAKDSYKTPKSHFVSDPSSNKVEEKKGKTLFIWNNENSISDDSRGSNVTKKEHDLFDNS